MSCKSRYRRQHAWLTLPVVTSILLAAGAGFCHARTWRVTPGGTGDAPTIHAAVDSAAAGDTVLVACGIYTMRSQGMPADYKMIKLRRSVYLLSETGSPECAILDAEEIGGIVIEVMDVPGPIEIRGFTVTHGRTFALTGGGGLTIYRSSAVTVRDCAFVANVAGWPAGIGYGGAVAMAWSYGVAFESCRFLGNTAGDAGSGGAVYLGTDTDVSFIGCRFDDNFAGFGAAIVANGYDPTATIQRFSQCTFTGNRGAWRGGAMGCVYSGVIVEECLFTNNAAPHGGVLYALESTPILRNCTISGNSAQEGGSVLQVLRNARPEITHCILAFNRGAPIFACDESGRLTMTCCDVFGNDVVTPSPCLHQASVADGNFVADPLFCDRDHGDFQLAGNSPCLPGQHPGGVDCGRIGAFDEGCGATATRATTWGAVKSLFR